MNLSPVEKVAEAVLYEGYMLYPYRPSAVKNQQRWNFGVLYPPEFCATQLGSESSSMQTECLVNATRDTRLTVKVRFLQIVQRSIARLRTPGREAPEGEEPDCEIVDRLEVGGRGYQPWQEAVERAQIYPAIDPHARVSASSMQFTYPAGKSFEYLRDEQGLAVGAIVRQWEALEGTVGLTAKYMGVGVFKLTVRVENRTSCSARNDDRNAARDATIMHSLVSAHTILGADHGEFVSLLEPARGFEMLVSQCNNIGTWPVLAGDGAQAILSSPIILYDHPQIAPESAGNLFDSTEIDEILSLRILTLTDEEKREMRDSDERSREILERTEKMPPEQFMKLHGALRGLNSAKEEWT
jgi:hypothetical protein